MKQSKDSQKRSSALILIVFLLAALPLVFAYNQTLAQTATEIQNKIEEKDAEIKRLEQEIAQYQSEIEGLSKQKSTLQGEIRELDLTRKKLNADISVTENKIDRTNLKIENLSRDIGDKEAAIRTNLSAIGLGIRDISEIEGTSMMVAILSHADYTEVWNDIDNLVTLRESLRENTTALRETKVVLEDTRAATIEAKEELARLSSELVNQKKIVEQNTAAKNKLLKQTQNSEASYQTLLRDRIAKRDAFEKELRDFETQLKYILDPSTLPTGRVLSWPLSNIFITQLFGKTSASGRLYASGSHSGVDFRAAVGTPVMAMADGKVMGVGDTDLTCAGASFGKFVFIEYTNGLASAYGHLSLVTTREGQQVRRGQVVAYSGNTGHSTGPHLHVSLYAPGAAEMTSKPSAACEGRSYRMPVAAINAYLDVLKYLPPYAASQIKQ